MLRRTARKGQRQWLSTLLHCLPLSLSLKLGASVSHPAPKTRPELLAGSDEEYQIFAAASSFVQEMGTASVKSRNLIAFVSNPFIVRLIILPFQLHASSSCCCYSTLTTTTVTSSGKENLKTPNQNPNRKQFLKSVRHECKSRSLRNVVHGLETCLIKCFTYALCLSLTILITCWVPLQEWSITLLCLL